MRNQVSLFIIGAFLLIHLIQAQQAPAPTGASSLPTVPPTQRPSSNPAIPVNQTWLMEQSCPFSSWRGDKRNCFECRWCPFRRSTCCEASDEVTILKNLQVSGKDKWDCFITLAHFQECGKCSPDSRKFLQQRALAYAPHPLNWSIRVCKKACSYIWNQCREATLVGSTEPVVPKGMTMEDFCINATDESAGDCYNAAPRAFGVLAVLMWVCLLVLAL